MPGAWAVAWLWEHVVRAEVRARAHQEDTPAALGNSEVHRVQNLPTHVVTRKPESAKLVLQQPSIFAVGHAIYIFDHKGFWSRDSENTVKLTVKEVNRLLGVPSTSLAIALAGVATGD